MKIRFMKMFLLAMFGLTPCLTGSSLDEVEKQLAEIANHEEVLQASKILTKIVFGSDKDAISALNSENKIRAIDLIGRYKIVECLPVLIDTIERIAPVYDGIVPLDIQYPCIGAIVNIGEPSVPCLKQAIGKEDDGLRLRLMSYVLMKIKSKQGALDYLDKCLAGSEITYAQRERFNTAKIEVSKWFGKNPHDHKNE